MNSNQLKNKTNKTRKYSCVNARGIPTAPYQVLPVLSCPRGGVPLLGGPCWGGGYPCRGVLPAGVHPILTCLGYPPPSDLIRVPSHRTWPGYPPSDLARILPPSDLTGIPPSQTWLGYPPSDLVGVPPPPMCGQTENITFLHPSDAVGNNFREIKSRRFNLVFSTFVLVLMLA